MESHASLPESHHARVQVGDRALLRVEGVPDPLETRVEAIADTIDPTTRSFLIRMQIANPDHRLKAGAFARVEIFPSLRREAVLVSREAIRSEAGRTSVLVLRGGRAVEVPVRIGLTSEDEVEVLSGLEPDEEVIAGRAARSLAPGTPVRALPGRGPSA
jgi:membrane fusion protein (multidrug efflux system)